MKPRVLPRTILKALKSFPAIVVTGPRQSGKTTLLKMLFSKTHRFVTLEDPDIRMRAKEDPLHFGQMPSMYYLRTRDGLEVDLVVELGQKLHLFEIKSSMTIFPRHASSLLRIVGDLKSSVKASAIVSASTSSFHVQNAVYNYNWKNLLGR